MISSRNNNRLLGVVTLGSALLMPIGYGYTQEKPRSLVPSFVNEQSGATERPAAKMPKADLPVIESDGFSSTAPSGKVKTDGSLVIEKLGALSSSSTGLLSKQQGGLGAQMWSGSPLRRIGPLLSSIPFPRNSPQMQDLYRRILLTGAAIPSGDLAGDGIVDIRLKKLVEAGFYADAISLAERLQRGGLNRAGRKSLAEAYLLSGGVDKGCDLATATEKRADDDVFWAKLNSFCLIKSGKLDKAELSIALLEEQGVEDDLFFALFAALAGDKKPKISNSDGLEPLHKAMAVEAKVDLPVEGATHPYQEQMAAIKASASSELTAENLLILWKLAQTNGDYIKVRDQSFGFLKTIPAKDYGFEFNIEAVKIYLLQGDEASAGEWERVIRRASSQGSNTERLQGRKDVSRLDSYILLSGIRGIARWNTGSFKAWLRTTEADPEQGVKATFLLSMMESLGYPISSQDWEELLLLPLALEKSVSNHGIERGLVSAAVKKRVGETVALALMSVGQDGPGNISTTSLVAAVSGLKRIGLEKEARMLALEAAVLKGL